MLHAATILIGLWMVWLLLTQGWSAPDIAIGAGVALLCVAISARLGGVGGGGRAFAYAPRLIFLALGRVRAVLSGAFSTLRAGLAGDVTLQPALVRVRLRPSSDFARAALADMISAAPGAVVVEADADGLLVHVLDEEAIEAADLGRFEDRVLRALDGVRA